MMEEKLLVGILLAVGLIVSIGIGIASAHGTNEPEHHTMTGMMNEMMGKEDSHMPMMGMMSTMHEEMTAEMEEMMNDEDLRNEMIEHMKDCPMMKHFNQN